MDKKNFLANTWENSNELITKNTKGIELSENKINNLIGRSISVGPFYWYVLNFCNLPQVVMEQKNISLTNFFGIEAQNMSLEVLMSRIHPGDISYIQKCEEVITQTMEEVYLENLLDLKISYCFRIKDKNDRYKLILHQMIPLELDKKGKFAYSINIHTDIEHITTTNSRTLSFFGFNGMPSFIGIDPYGNNNFKTTKKIFTNRETEIIRYFASGFTTKEISEKLLISEHTVKTHNKNILSKTECKNFKELIAKSIKEGLI